jgi:hypothetical protein
LATPPHLSIVSTLIHFPLIIEIAFLDFLYKGSFDQTFIHFRFSIVPCPNIVIFAKWGKQGCYKPLPLKGTSSSMF